MTSGSTPERDEVYISTGGLWSIGHSSVLVAYDKKCKVQKHINCLRETMIRKNCWCLTLSDEKEIHLRARNVVFVPNNIVEQMEQNMEERPQYLFLCKRKTNQKKKMKWERMRYPCPHFPWFPDKILCSLWCLILWCPIGFCTTISLGQESSDVSGFVCVTLWSHHCRYEQSFQEIMAFEKADCDDSKTLDQWVDCWGFLLDKTGELGHSLNNKQNWNVCFVLQIGAGQFVSANL